MRTKDILFAGVMVCMGMSFFISCQMRRTGCNGNDVSYTTLIKT